MTTELIVPATTTPTTALPEHWLAQVNSNLLTGENVLSSVEVDLDARLRFTKGIIVVTEKRLLARAPGETEWKHWSYRPGLRLAHHDHAGVGHLELFDDHGRLASWRFTLGQNLHAIRVLEQFVERLDSHLTGQPVLVAEQEVCPSCKAPLEPDQEECPVCADRKSTRLNSSHWE